ncbi:hypothetical protein EII29_02395 [Leptotrichia sp. OH3620_COT-345]|uniref:hypothetical protein n=1 Tax=Leptotrichia sp. OH3620_COT-345 TaxID=2491048 RepID=UPI000F64D444|nr:hypothetical protein [Leptotrichia sp. OH3620_COT-345]RRD40348.1 hypothetical protein EII29_02395 [Leptotrichia sp. OH3620_COT-345]
MGLKGKYMYLENETDMILDYGKSYLSGEYFINHLYYSEENEEIEERINFETEMEMLKYLKVHGKQKEEVLKENTSENFWIESSDKDWER